MISTKIYFCAKDLSDPKDDPNSFIECSNTMEDFYENIDDYNPNMQRKILIVFDDMIVDIVSNKRFQAIIKGLFIRCRKLIISLVFITQSCFSFQNDVRLNSTHYLIMKINSRKELQNIAITFLVISGNMNI